VTDRIGWLPLLLTAAVVPDGLYHGSKLGRGVEGGRFFLERKLRIRHITTRGRSRQPPPDSDLDEGLSLWPYHPSVRPAGHLSPIPLSRSVQASVSLALEAGEKMT
jgi:hypothetical protein